MAFLMALILGIHFDQGWWSLAWALLAGSLSTPVATYTSAFSRTKKF